MQIYKIIHLSKNIPPQYLILHPHIKTKIMKKTKPAPKGKITLLSKEKKGVKMSDELCQRLYDHFGEMEFERFVVAFPGETVNTGTLKKWRLRTRIFADIKLNISIPDFILKYKMLRGGYYYWLKLYYLFIKTK